MSPRSRRRRTGEDEEHPDERWMASYMDMVTVLMCMFIVLFAMSSVDEQKYQQLKTSLATGFGVTEVGAIDTAEGIVVPPGKVDEQGEGEALPPEDVTEEGEGFPKDAAEAKQLAKDLDLARTEVQDLIVLREKIRANLEAEGLGHTVEFELHERGLTIRLIGSQTFFHGDKAVLTSKTVQVLDAMAPVLAATAHGVSIEGHSAKGQTAPPYATNWELSVARSVNVLRHLVEHGDVDAERVAAIGYGAARPLGDQSSEAQLKLDRRVDIVVLSDAPETVRELIPGIEAEP